MGKAKKNKISSSSQGSRSSGFTEHILEDNSVRPPGRIKARNRRVEDDEVCISRSSMISHYRSSVALL